MGERETENLSQSFHKALYSLMNAVPMELSPMVLSALCLKAGIFQRSNAGPGALGLQAGIG